MEEFITVSAKTVKDAILEASLKLETFRDNIEYEVIEEGSNGFFGIGSRKAVIKARKKTVVEDILKEDIREEKKESRNAGSKDRRKDFKKKENRGERKAEAKAETKAAEKKAVKEEPAAVPVEEEAAYEKTLVDDQKYAAEAVKEERKERKTAVLTEEEAKEAGEKAEKFLKDVLNTMDMQVEVKSDYSDETLNLELAGDDMGVLIGKRGQTLDSLQYLTSLVVNKGRSGYIRVKVDTENYRSRRKETLENLAKNIAYKVKRTKRPVFLEPMNPYERRIIHSALQNDPYVSTHSEGEEPYRKVVVTLKRNK
ncbi:MAG: RNA-binding cell elongation regulator Jag/EloR [Eubacteriales bacterium]|nr:RNA-binding cell elongation regulator Jag/EloR [Eubacteriales bacterium]